MLLYLGSHVRGNSRLYLIKSPLRLKKRRQRFIRTRNETLSVAMRVAVIRIYDSAGNMIEKREHAGDFKEP